jgi:ribonucleoside-diphosphate reductase alpha chain
MASLEFSSNAMKVFNSRYLRQAPDGAVIETPVECFRRVAAAIALSEAPDLRPFWTDQFFEIMRNCEFLPAGRTLSLAGTGAPLVSNCVVLHVEDSLDKIFQTLEDGVILHKGGSGIGFPLHLLRPAGLPCKRTLGMASGPVSFLSIYSRAFYPILNHGRESANMAVMRIDHPDILEFMSAKAVEGKFSNFNFSIAFTDDFMRTVVERPETPMMCTWLGTLMKPREITRDSYGKILSIVDVDMTVGELFDRIIALAWKNGEPGCVFIDTVNQTNPLPGLGPIECCNPCGEQYLHDGDACNLGAINLERFVSPGGTIDFDRLKAVVRIAVRFLDDVIDQTQFQVARVRNSFGGNRRVGLGIMGLADMLFLLGLQYDSDEGREAARSVMKCISETAIAVSEELGVEKGSFPNIAKSKWAGKRAMRNSSLTNVAPTGSTSMLLDVSSGIEPYFALAYKRMNCLEGSTMEPFINKHLKKALDNCGCAPDVMEKVIQTGSVQGIAEIPEGVRRVFRTSLDIAAVDHCLMQAALQEFCCNAISKTINFPTHATVADVKAVYIDGWRLGLKGMTAYRNGSRETQVLVIPTADEPIEMSPSACTDGKCDL